MRSILVLALAGLMGGAVLGAQAPPPPSGSQTDSQAPLSNAAVARLSAISGAVSTQRGDTGTWETGAINTPLVNGDKVAAGEGGRAEVQLDYADLLRLSGNSQANLVNLTDSQIQVQLAAGLADYVVLKDAQAGAEIDTPNVAVRPRGAGVYRIEVVSDSETQVIVREGEADISTPQGSTLLKKGQLITIEGTDTPQYKIADAPGNDEWDRWNQQRDTAVMRAESVQKTNPYYTGVQDLDNYGYWTVVPGYGEVWVPNESAGWSPYSDGNWNWEPGWGWTWVDYAPWGWAPYHYGRWFMYGSLWSWWPGPVTPFYRPIWAPAYVSFFGWGGGFGVGIGFGGWGYGSIGWLPIGPCDPFHPWWGIGGRFGYGGFGARLEAPLAMAGRGRVAYSNLNGLAGNARLRAAMMRVPSANFGRAGMMGARERVSADEVRQGQAIRGSLPAPSRQSLLGGNRMASSAARPHDAATHFFGTRAAAQSRSGFAQQRSASFEGQAEERGATTRSPSRPAASNNSADGWQRFGSGGSRSMERATAPAAQNRGESNFSREAGSAGSGGWQRFQRSPSGSGAAGAGRSSFNGSRSGYDGSEMSSRPRLEVGHPIVDATPRSSSFPRAATSGGGRMMSAPRGGMSGGGYRGGGGGGFHGGGGGHMGGGGHGGGGRGR